MKNKLEKHCKGVKRKMEITFCETKAGKGYKIVVNGQWLYTSKAELLNVVTKKSHACIFRKIEEKKQ